MDSGKKWKIIRITLLLGSVAIAPFYSPVEVIDWRLTAIFASLTAVVLFGWLAMMRYQAGVDLSDPFSWDSPFWPVTKYPVRYWLMTSYSAILQGLSALLASASLDGRFSLAIFLLVTGAALQLSLQRPGQMSRQCARHSA